MKQAPTKTAKKKKNPNSLFHRIAAWLHLWLGLVTGLIMIIVCLTACIWVFNDEITVLLEPETRVARQELPVIPPSRLHAVADSLFPGKKVNYASYRQGRAVHLVLGEGRRGNTTIRVNPYTAEVLSVKVMKKGETDFFRFILNGHRFLWMEPKVGRVIVNYSTLIFVILLITGLVLWWPKKWNKSTRKQAFNIKTSGSSKRLNYDLHNVLGFYSLLVLAAIALTGMVYGIEWYSKGLYWVTTGTPMAKSRPAKSDSLAVGRYFGPDQAMDSAWHVVIRKHPEAEGFYYSYADTAKPASTIGITIYPRAGQYYQNRNYVFDQHTLKPLKGNNKIYDGPFEKASVGNKIRRMNYDIHVGSVLGLPGRILAFCAALIGASLPVTGLIIWLGKKKKGKKKAPAVAKGQAAG